MNLCLVYHNLKRKVGIFYFSRLSRKLPSEVVESGILFVHVPKAAGVSICAGLYGREIGHRRAIDYKRASNAEFGRLKKFSVVRDPYARLLSAYEFLRKGGMSRYKYDHCMSGVVNKFSDFDEFVLEWLSKANNYKNNVHFIPQVDFLFDGCGNLLVDKFGKLEFLGQFVDCINQEWGLQLKIDELNVSGGGKRSILSVVKNRQVIDEINVIYRKDFELLGYPML